MAISLDARGGNAGYYAAVRGQEALASFKRSVRRVRKDAASPSEEMPDTGEKPGITVLATAAVAADGKFKSLHIPVTGTLNLNTGERTPVGARAHVTPSEIIFEKHPRQ
jgi:hypothetical protein